MKIKGYKIYDTKAKSWVLDETGNDFSCPTIAQAKEYKDSLLEKGEYPDEPHSVFDIRAMEINNLVTGI